MPQKMSDADVTGGVTSIIYFLYHTKKMNPNAMSGSWHINEVFDNACQLLMGMTVEQFEEIEDRIRKEMML